MNQMPSKSSISQFIYHVSSVEDERKLSPDKLLEVWKSCFAKLWTATARQLWAMNKSMNASQIIQHATRLKISFFLSKANRLSQSNA